MNFRLIVIPSLAPFREIVKNLVFFIKMFFQKKLIFLGVCFSFFIYWGFWSNNALALFSKLWGFFLVCTILIYVSISLRLRLDLKSINIFIFILWVHISKTILGFFLSGIPYLDSLRFILYPITILFAHILTYIELLNSDLLSLILHTKITIFKFTFKNWWTHYWVYNYWGYLKLIGGLESFFEFFELIFLPFFYLFFLIIKVFLFGWVNSEIVFYENFYNLSFEVLIMVSYVWSFIKPAVYIVLLDMCYYIYLLSTFLFYISVGLSIALRLVLGFITWAIDWLVTFRYMVYPYESYYSIDLPKQKQKPKEED